MDREEGAEGGLEEAVEEEDNSFFSRIFLEDLYKVIHGHWDVVLLQEKEVVLN